VAESSNKTAYYGLGAAGVALVGVVIWLSSLSGKPPKSATEQTAAPDPGGALSSALGPASKEDPEKLRMNEELKKIKEALAEKEVRDKERAEEETRRANEAEAEVSNVKKQKYQKILSYLASTFFDGDSVVAEAFLKVHDSVLLGAYDRINDSDPTNDFKDKEDYERYVIDRLVVQFENTPVLRDWLKSHERDPRKFIQEILNARQTAGGPEDPTNKFDFSKYVSVGSGFWISSDGWIVTNEHVVSDSKTVDLRLRDGKIIQAKVVLADESKDLALLKAEAAPAQWLAVSKGETDLQLGRTVFTVGYPSPRVQGVEPKFTDGRISAASGIGDRKDSYQTTVPVQHGNSGGALVDFATGWVVGVINAKLESGGGVSADNVSYAIKVNVLSGFIDSVPEAKAGVLKSAPKPLVKGNETAVIDRATESSVLILRPR
jgi:S1-C subfamily serine protease